MATSEEMEIERLKLRIRGLAEALEFYASGDWSDGYPGGIRHGDNSLDFGEVARQALNHAGLSPRQEASA